MGGLDLPCSAGHSGELVDLSCRLRLSHAWLLGSQCGGGHPGRILRLRHHFQVWCRAHYLQRHCCQVPVGVGVRILWPGMSNMPCVAKVLRIDLICEKKKKKKKKKKVLGFDPSL